MPHRLLLSGLAIGPALAAVTLPLPLVGSGLTLAIGGATGLYALLSSIRIDVDRHDGLLHPAARLPRDLPEQSELRGAVSALLSDPDRDQGSVFPLNRQGATAQVLQRLVESRYRQQIHALPKTELVELWLVGRILRGSPGEAGEFAQLFRDPAAMLALRDEVDRLALRRAIFDRDHAAFQASLAQWEKGLPQGATKGSLLLALQALKVPDIDLWHRIVLEHDPRDPQQRAAALWCLRQKQCDRATVAAFLASAAADGRLQAAARNGDEVYLNAVQDIIEHWNAGYYRGCELALDPVDAVAHDAGRMTAALDELATLTGTRRWPDPHGVFTEYTGRKPRLRSHWCLRRGRLTARPSISDYVEFDALACHITGFRN